MNTPASHSPTPMRSRKRAELALDNRWTAWWGGMAPRERRAASFAAWVVGLALMWWVALGPAIATLRSAPELHAALDAQLTKMQALAATAEQLRGQNSVPTPSRGAAQSSLEQATRLLGDTAQVSIQGDKAILTLRGAAPQALADWLNQVRVNARLVPVNAQLERGNNPDGWRGQITLTGPGLGSNAP